MMMMMIMIRMMMMVVVFNVYITRIITYITYTLVTVSNYGGTDIILHRFHPLFAYSF